MRRVGAIQVCGAIACALLLWGCGGSSECTPGTTLACICSNSASGAQSCNSEGSGYEPCVCEAGSASDAAGSVADTNRSGTDASSPSVPSEYVLIPAGTFTMGSSESEPCRFTYEWPQHEVTLTGSFWLKTTEVTQGEWEALMGNNPSQKSSGCDDCPVETVNWWDSLAYCNALSAAEGLTACYDLECTGTAGADMECTGVTVNAPDENPYACEGYRLPTEAEWEYAARAGTTEATYNGDIAKANCIYASPVLEPIAWYKENSGWTTHVVATKEANPWGLYDMLGNVYEWTWDTWDWDTVYESGASENPTGPSSGSSRVHRGCSWINAARYCRAAYRRGLTPVHRRDFNLGFRPARSLP